VSGVTYLKTAGKDKIGCEVESTCEGVEWSVDVPERQERVLSQ
jgi:hypothetical protein